ncbi:MAG: hypothetical protein AB7U75_14845 [Hyphomicrobiaceae bacterium]
MFIKLRLKRDPEDNIDERYDFVATVNVAEIIMFNATYAGGVNKGRTRILFRKEGYITTATMEQIEEAIISGNPFVDLTR